MSELIERLGRLSHKQLMLLVLDQQEKIEAARRQENEPIAVVGIGCRFPGGVGSPDQFWDLLREGRDAVREVPADRWDIDAFFDPDPDRPARMSVRSGGFLDEIAGFDAPFFGISPREATSMDPQQRLLLEVAWEALEHAGIAADRLAGTPTGVYVGICNSDYFQRLLQHGRATIDPYIASGNAFSVAAGRLAYCLGLQGPAIAVDTSCSASLAALHIACGSLRRGEISLALCGGVNIICAPETNIALSKAHMLAPDGRCKTFDESADGYARGEGCGIVVLRRLSDALANEERILGVIQGTASNQDGRSGGLTVPNGRAQEAVIRAAMADAGIAARDIDYIEAHGTGTSLGDPIEVRAVSAALGAGRGAEDAVVIGSVKTNIGHLESAAGIAGLIKVLLSLQNERIPPHLHFSKPNGHIDWASHPVIVLPQGKSWPRGERRRIAGVSSFGFSGTNVHAIVAEAPLAATATAKPERPVHCLPLSARSDAALRDLAQSYLNRIEADPQVAVADLAFTASVGRSHQSERLAVVAGSLAELQVGLRAFLDGTAHPGLHRGTAVPGRNPELVFMFTGQGVQHPGMAQRLYDTAPVFRAVIDQANTLLGRQAQGRSLIDVLFAEAAEDHPLHDTAWTQPALFAVEYGLAQLWRSWGVEPAAVTGHSVGEYVAACVAGVYSFEDGLRLIAERGRLMGALPPGGRMASIFASRAAVEEAITPFAGAVSIAALNGPENIVIAGIAEAVDAVVESFVARGIRARALLISLAAHSPLVEPAMDAMEACAARVPMLAPRIPVAWNVTGGEALPGGGAPDALYWRRHLREPVRFAEGIASLRAAGWRSFLEVGPHPTLTALAQQNLGEGEAELLWSLRRGQDDWQEMLGNLARLYVGGVPVDWAGVARPYAGGRIALPTYPFERQTYWVPLAQPESMASAPAFEQAPAVAPQPAAPGAFFDLHWQPAPLPARAAPALLAPDGFVTSARARFRDLAERFGLSIYDRLVPELDRLAGACLAQALRQLGFDPAIGRVFDLKAEADSLGVAHRHRRLFEQLMASLVRDGVLGHRGAALEIIGPLSVVDPEAAYQAAKAEFGDVDGELDILRRCGSGFAQVLAGDLDPLELMFPGGSFAEAAKIYVESPSARTYNTALAEALASAIEHLPPGAVLRVLEIGAGTGGTTTFVLPRLPADRVEYTFTDVSPLFLERATEKFAAYPFLRTALLDIGRDPLAQGFQAGQFDIVIAANVLHATEELDRTMGHVRSLMADGALLFLLEGSCPQRWSNMAFGLIEGWWRFTDTDLRPDNPLVDPAVWRVVLERQGFSGFHAVPGDGAKGVSEAQMAIILARADITARGWTLIGDEAGLGAVLAERLRARGDAVRLLSAEAEAPADLDGGRLVYLGALETAVRADDDLATARRSMALACEAPIRWLAAFGRASQPGRAWLVTQGAQPVPDGSWPGMRWQAPLWGVGRAFSLEQPDRWGGLIDLPPDAGRETLAETLLAAIDAADSETESAYRDGLRYVPRLRPAAAPAASAATFRPDATYLITGGFGGLGQRVALWMAARGARHIALLSRRAEPDMAAIRAIEALGARVIPLSGDVADAAAMAALLSRLGTEAPPLRGIIHAAVDTSAAPVDRLTPEMIRRMLRAKIEGTVVLEQVTRALELDFTVLFSSTTALLGSAELAHYAAANLFLDATAQALNRPGRRVLAVNWGAWDEIRMASAEARSSFQESGLLSMPCDWALDALGRLLAAGVPRAIAARIDWTLYKPLLESHGVRPILSEVGAAPHPAEAPKALSAAPDAKSSLVDRLAAVPPAARRALVQGFVVAAAAAVLGTEESAVKPGLDLFEIGMDSLMAIALRRRLEAGVGKALPSNLIFNNPRVEVLATLVADLLDVTAADDATEAPPPPPAAATAPVADLIAEASHSQRALWFLHQQAPRSAAYNVTLSVRVLSALDPSALRAALQALMDRHAILRTTYAVVGGAPRQQVALRAEAVLDIHDATGLSTAALRGQLAADAGRPFDLASGPVIRAAVYTSGPQDHALLLSMHHIAVDGWSIMMLIDELLQLYGQASGQGAADLAQPPLSYADYARWQAEMLEGEEGSHLWDYWRGKLLPLPERRPLPIDHARPEIQTFDGASFGFTLEAAAVEGVTALARQARTTPFVVLLAAFQVMLARLSGSGEVITGTSTFSRSNPDFADIVGNFSNSVPIRGQLPPGLSFRDLIAQIGATVREAIEMQEFPLPLLVQRLQPERSAGGSPLFDTFFSLLRYSEFKGFVLLYGEESDTPVEAHGLRLTPLPIEQGSGQFDLSLQMVEIAEGLRGAFKYRTDLFDEASIRAWARDYGRILEKATGNPDLPLDALHDAPREATGAEDAVISLLDRLGKQDIRLSLKAGKLRVNAPKGALDEATKALLAEHRDGIIAALAAAGPQDAPMGTGHASGLTRISRAGPLPVSSAQRRLWFLDRMEASRSLYNVGVAVRISGPVEIERLRDAARALIARHESLRMRISEQGGAPVLHIGEADDSATAILRLGAMPAERRGAAALAEAEAWLARPFDLATGPLGRFLIIAVAPEECVLVASMHHIVSDGWSITIAVRDILAIYGAGTDAALPPLTIQYADYAAWEREQIASGRLAAQLDYWQAQLRDAPALLALPTDRPRPASPSYRGARLSRYLDGALTDRLAARGREFGATPFMSLLTAWMVLMYRYSGQDDIVIGAPSGNRPDSSLEGVIGCLVNIMALRGRLGGNPSFAELLAQVRQTVLAGLDHGDVPFDAIVEKLNPERHANHTPIFQVLFTLMSFSTRVDPPEGLAVELLPHATQASRFDLSVDLVVNDNAADPGGFKVAYEYASDLFDPATIDRLHAHFEGIIAVVAAAPATRIDDLPLGMPQAEQALLARWNETAASHDRRHSVHHLLEMVAARMPDAPAVIAGDTTLSYRALDEAANRLAHLLVGCGVGQGARVAVCLERTEELPVALAAVLKAGAAYVPLDPHHPGERLRDIIGDAEVSCVVTLGRFAHLFEGGGARVVLLDRVADELAAQPGTPPDVDVRPEDVAYVIYTSGSTGKPKGVQVEHRNLVSLLEAMRREPGLAAGDALLAVTTISFDIAGLEIWLPLSLGGRLVIASRGEGLDGEALARLVERHDVRMLQATPASWRLLLDAGWPGKRDLTALCGGEAMPRDLAGALLRRTAALWNMYGPTETTIWSTAARITDAAAPIRIGRPIANTRVYVLDQAGSPLPIGVVGELCIGGEGVARGYWKRPELTAERFVTITLPDGTAERIYRTGDDARFCPDGEIDYLGRRDQQVKIRGYRIELGEIEAALSARPDVRESVVAVREDRPGEKRLVGYVVPAPGARFDADAARVALRGHLPEYMVPNRLVVLPSLPLTPNGKIDRRALPAPPSIVAAKDARPLPVMSAEERRVAAIWCAVLQLDRVGLYDNFFDLGGHSMLLIKLHGDLRMAFDTDELMLVELFQHTTVAAQALRLCAAPRNEGAAPGARSRAERQAYV